MPHFPCSLVRRDDVVGHMQSVKQSPVRVGTKGVAVYALLALGLMLVLLARQAYAVQITLAWDDPLNAPSNVVGYRLYYLQAGEQTPVILDVGKQTTYTLSGLQAGQT